MASVTPCLQDFDSLYVETMPSNVGGYALPFGSVIGGSLSTLDML